VCRPAKDRIVIDRCAGKRKTLNMTKISANFLQDVGARSIIAALAAAGGETRFVGGCVRDAIVGLRAVDIDLATTLLPEKVLDVLTAAGFTARPLGAAHGVVSAWYSKKRYEIATLREDIATDGRHALVAYTQDWAVDARRRDFTINALSTDLNGQVYDYVGGLDDLRTQCVRFIGEASTRIHEDYLRILRYYRFHARFGTKWDAVARGACRENRMGLAQLSRERITEELHKLLSIENPQEKILAACAAMHEDQIFLNIIPELKDILTLERLLAREKIYDQQSWLLRLAAWGGQAPQFDERFLDQFVFTRTDRADIKLFATLDFGKLNHALYYHGTNAVRAAVILRASDSDLSSLMQQIEFSTPHEFPLQAEDLLQMGVLPGPRLGEILRTVENWWLENNCLANADECRTYATTLAMVSSA